MQLASDSNEEILIYLGEAAAKALKSDIEEDNVPKTITTDLKLDITSGNDKVNSENVVAFLKGTEKPDEYVVISSHLDHIGITADGQINNGADDDGSGTVALLEIAQAFKKQRMRAMVPNVPWFSCMLPERRRVFWGLDIIPMLILFFHCHKLLLILILI